MKNLQLVFLLERPEFFMTFLETADANVKVNHIITNVKYNVCLIQPSDKILEMCRMAYISNNPDEMSIDIP